MSLSEYLRELSLPLRSVPVILFALLILLVIGFVVAVSIMNPWVAAGLTVIFGFALLPGITRYLVHIAEWRAKGQQAEPPSTEMFTLMGRFWQLSALLMFVAGSAAWFWIDRELGIAWAFACAILFSILYPATVGVLVITHSVVQACNPRALLSLIASTGAAYWYAPLTALAAVGLPVYVARYSALLAVMVFIYLLFAFFAVAGGVLRKPGLIDKVAIPEPVEPEAGRQLADLQRQRTSVLTHAYGFASRGNRQGAFEHIDDWLQRDPHPDNAWRWFLEQMLLWEQSHHGLYFAQHYIAKLLAHGEQREAAKVMLRCRLVSESFRPLPEDVSDAIEAAEATGNSELADVLRRS